MSHDGDALAPLTTQGFRQGDYDPPVTATSLAEPLSRNCNRHTLKTGQGDSRMIV